MTETALGNDTRKSATMVGDERTLPGPAATNAARTCILVLGMHRSGTSALTRVLGLLGAELPKTLLGAHRGNEAGHWEPRRLMEINERILAEGGSRWDDWRAFDPFTLPADRIDHYRREIVRTIDEEYGSAPLFVLKDPRICRFAALYEDALATMGIACRFILPHRNPLAVIASHSSRDGMTSGFAGLLWLRHVLDAEAATRGKPRAFIAYDALLENWRGEVERLAKSLDLEWPRGVDDAADDIDSNLLQDLKHHAPAVADLEADASVAGWIKQAYSALLILTREPGNTRALETLDRVSSEFDGNAAIFGAASIPEMTARERTLLQKLNKGGHQNGGLADSVKSKDAEIKRLSGVIRTTGAEQDDLRREIVTLRNTLTSLERDLALANVENSRLQSVLDGIVASSSWRLTRPIRLAKKTAAQFRTASALALNMAREGDLTPGKLRRAIVRLPALISEGRFSNPTDAAGLAETFSAAEVRLIREQFDPDHYCRNNPDIAQTGIDPFQHFMRQGWKEGRDPSADFSVSYYLRRYPDIARAGINPLIHYVLHGRKEKRSPLPHRKRLERLDYRPKVSAIVPNYNHAAFLEQRIESILAQTYDNIDIVILDDCSSDDSRQIIKRYCELFPDRVRAIFNETNSGNVFRQWRKGVENGDSDLVWICESDDYCEPDFLENLVPYFRDRSVNIAFGAIQFCDREGNPQSGLDQYREGAEAGIWHEAVVRPAHRWFVGGFGVNNVIANVGGCIWRRQNLPSSVWEEAETFSVVGDWYLYCHIAGGGQIAFDPAAVAYFRQHGANTSVTAFVTPKFYEEHHRLMSLLRSTWDVPATTVEKFVSKVDFQYRHFKLEKKLGPITQYLDKDKLLSVDRQKPHILIAFLGFHPGGGEVFPINLANELCVQGYQVSMLALDMSHVNQSMLEKLNHAIPVYDASWVAEIGADRFLSEAGISLIHSHMVSLEMFFFQQCKIGTNIPYLVTLHGSYEAGNLDKEFLKCAVEKVAHWVYLSDKNLAPFRDHGLSTSNFTKIGNAVPEDPLPFPKTREMLGIKPDAVVFTLVARGIKRKGWRAAISAFKQLRDRRPDKDMHLLLAGEGEEADQQAALHGDDPDITFLGFQSRIPGLYRLSDCAVVPTRFAGESFPLCIIEAMQAGKPVIATRTGEIESMLSTPEGTAGVLVEPIRETNRFIETVSAAMEIMLDPTRRSEFARLSQEKSRMYSMERMTSEYDEVYSSLLNETQTDS